MSLHSTIFMSLWTFYFFTFPLAESHVQLRVSWSQVFTILNVKGHNFGKMWISKTPCVSIKLNSNSKVSLSMSLGCFPGFKIYTLKFMILLRKNAGKSNKSSLSYTHTSGKTEFYVNNCRWWCNSITIAPINSGVFQLCSEKGSESLQILSLLPGVPFPFLPTYT